ncbi:MAG TPA: efflux RND transporter periplasmic adaptor subunit [Rhizomicrobium sp.]|jgi:RND family efflux transporter MFP subunit|nr:efflux RND transporter periplasmic adaptor subunit [Rhizomicrobium sp.]
MPTDLNLLSANGKRWLRLAGIVAAGVAAVIVVSGIVTRLQADRAVRKWTSAQAIQTVSVLIPSRSRGSKTLVLPATLDAFYDAPIYARVPGYLRIWYKDIGAKVHKGDVLAIIDTPELDQQLDQAKAQLVNALAAEKLSQSTADRWTSLLALDAVSKQEEEDKTADLAVKQAEVTAARANLDRLVALKGFARITAPFDGVVTSRSVDIGALIDAGAGSDGTPLFSVQDVHQMRVYVDVPQEYSAQIRSGVTATLTVPEYPGRVFSATLDSTSHAIDYKSNALLVELLANNPDDALKPGEFTRVRLDLPAGGGQLEVPASALIFRAHGLEVATVLPNHRVLMKPVTIAVDLGTKVEIGTGLSLSDRVIDNPPDSIATGDPVRLAKSDSEAVAAR